MKFSKKIQPVRMPATCNPLEIVDAVVMGHGGTDENNNYSAKLRYAVLKTMTMNACRRVFPFNIFRKSAICAKNDEQNQLVWHGDKGDPLVRVSDGVLIGISSFWRQGEEAAFFIFLHLNCSSFLFFSFFLIYNKYNSEH